MDYIIAIIGGNLVLESVAEQRRSVERNGSTFGIAQDSGLTDTNKTGSSP